MKQNRLLSVIVPVFNVEQYLDKCINSILEQTYKDLEIILVDDGSTDESGRICDRYANSEHRVSVIHQANGGIVSARKRGVCEAKGDYIAHIDADDWIDKEMFSKLMKFANHYDADIVTAGMVREYDDIKVDEYDNIEEGYYDEHGIKEKVLPILMYEGTFYTPAINIHITNKIYRTELAKKIHLLMSDDIRLGEDGAFVYPFIACSKKMYVCHEKLYHYRLYATSCVGTGKASDISGLRILYEHMCHFFDNLEKNEINYSTQIDMLMLYELLLRYPDTAIKIGEDGSFNIIKNLNREDKVVIYGAGKFGVRVKNIFEQKLGMQLVGWVDKTPREGVSNLNWLAENGNYDKVFLATANEHIETDMLKCLGEMGVESSKIAYLNVKEMSSDFIKNILEVDK